MRARWLRNYLADWRRRRSARRGADARWQEIRADLAAAEAGCVLLAGNSHAALLGAPRIAGRSSVNIAAGGATARGCALRLARCDAAARAAAAVLIIGTNDIVRRRHPDRPATGLHFEADIRRLLAILDGWAEQVFVAAIPPLGAHATSRDPAAVTAFSARLARLCAAEGHTFFDPFAALRSVDPDLATAGLHADGVHLSDYPALAAEIDRFVAAALADPAGRAPRVATRRGETGASRPALRPAADRTWAAA